MYASTPCLLPGAPGSTSLWLAFVSRFSAFALFALVIATLTLPIGVLAQTSPPPAPPVPQAPPPAPAVSAKDTVEPTTYLFAGIGGFFPASQSYRLNYTTQLGFLPLEANGGLLIPVTNSILTPLTLRYVNREAKFIANLYISTLSIEPGVRVYLEQQREKDFRIFAGAEGLIAQAMVRAEYQPATGSANDQNAPLVTVPIRRTYTSLGLGFDVGFAFPLTANTAIDGLVHTGFYLSDPASSGGIGNIGGVSLTADYRFGF